MGTKSAGWRMGPAMCIATLAFWGGLAQAEVTNPDGIAVIIGNKELPAHRGRRFCAPGR